MQSSIPIASMVSRLAIDRGKQSTKRKGCGLGVKCNKVILTTGCGLDIQMLPAGLFRRCFHIDIHIAYICFFREWFQQLFQSVTTFTYLQHPKTRNCAQFSTNIFYILNAKRTTQFWILFLECIRFQIMSNV